MTLDWAGRMAMGAVIVALPLLYALGMWSMVRCRARPSAPLCLLAGATVTGLPYLHHFAGRPDLVHLGQDVHPFWLGLLAAAVPAGATRLPARRFVGVACLAAALSLPAVLAQPLVGWARLPVARRATIQAGKTTLRVSRPIATTVAAFRETLARHRRPDEPVLMVPWVPGMYPVLGLDPPVWDPYPLTPARPSREAQLVSELVRARVRIALVDDAPLDRIDARRFRYNYPLTWAHLHREFRRVPTPLLPAGTELLIRWNPLSTPRDGGRPPSRSGRGS
jgi:hypothetical protein